MVVVVVVGTAAEIDRCYALLCFATCRRSRPSRGGARGDGRTDMDRPEKASACVRARVCLSLSLSSSIDLVCGWMVDGAGSLGLGLGLGRRDSGGGRPGGELRWRWESIDQLAKAKAKEETAGRRARWRGREKKRKGS